MYKARKVALGILNATLVLTNTRSFSSISSTTFSRRMQHRFPVARPSRRRIQRIRGETGLLEELKVLKVLEILLMPAAEEALSDIPTRVRT